MLFGPLAAAGQVIRSRSTRGMPFPPLVLTLVASLLWFIYGLYIFEVPIMIPNGLGIFFGITQISLYFWARRQEKSVAPAFEEAAFVPIASTDQGLLRDSSTASEGILGDMSSGIHLREEDVA